jgi:hypothetical protein
MTGFVCMSAMGQEANQADDSVVVFPLKIRAEVEISGPVIYLTKKNTLNLEGYITADLNEKISLFAGGGYSDYRYSQYNYEFTTKGHWFKAGVDFNLLNPETAEGKYWGGLGFHYGLDRFTYAVPSFRHDNYWGSVSSSLAGQINWGHFFEISGGFRTELFSNFSIGWLISIRKMIYTGADKNLQPIYYPGYGEGGKSLSYGINYFISFSIPYKKIKIRIKPETVEEPVEEGETQTPDDSQNLGRQGIGR